MQAHWLKRDGADDLMVVVLGWAADHRIVEHIVPEGFDAVCLYDYRNIPEDGVLAAMPFVDGLVKEITDREYEKYYLLAWSFGVWASERIFGHGNINFERAVAFNGTPFPVDERYGLGLRRIDVTLRGLRAGGMEAFNRRTYGDEYESWAPVLSPRSLEENISELSVLKNVSALPYQPSIVWNKAIIGEFDLIFPPENMLRFWGGSAESLPLPHYPFADPDIVLKALL